MTAFGIERNLEDELQRMADLVMAAVAPWSNGDTRRANRAIGQIILSTGSPQGREVLGWAVTSILHERIGLAWQLNWQPVDLDRLAARALKQPERALLGDAMAHHLSEYARRTVDPEWWTQLSDLAASFWWPPRQSYLVARGERESWRGLITSSVQLISLVWALPEIELLGPRPGEATPRANRADRPEVEPKVLERVRQILAKAESTTFEAEAETFTAAAQKLMARHSIDAALLAASQPTTSNGPGASRLGVDNPYDSLKVRLLSAVARANHCRVVWSKELGFVTLIGHREDRQAVETLFTSLLVQATTAMTQHGSRTDGRGRSRTTAFRRSFLAAFTTRIGERLEDATAEEVQTAVTEMEDHSPSSGQELVPLIERREAAVDAAMDEMFPTLRTTRGPAITDAEGWDSGTAAADRASLSGTSQGRLPR